MCIQYACRNKSCRRSKARKDDMEAAFVDLLKRIQPKPEVIRVFREVVQDVWKQKEASNRTQAEVIKQQMADIDQKLFQLEEAYIFGKNRIDRQTYERQLGKLREDQRLAQMAQV